MTRTRRASSVFAVIALLMAALFVPGSAFAADDLEALRNNEPGAPPAEYCTAEDVSITATNPRDRVYNPREDGWPENSNGLSYLYLGDDTDKFHTVYTPGQGKMVSYTSYFLDKNHTWDLKIEAPNGVKAGQKTAVAFFEPWTARSVPAEGLLTEDGVKLADLEVVIPNKNETDADGNRVNKLFAGYVVATFTEAAEQYSSIEGEIETAMGFAFLRGNSANTYKGSVVGCDGQTIDTATLKTEPTKYLSVTSGSWHGKVYSEDEHKFSSMSIVHRTDATNTCPGLNSAAITFPEGTTWDETDESSYAVSIISLDDTGAPTYFKTIPVDWRKTGERTFYTGEINLAANESLMIAMKNIKGDGGPKSNEGLYYFEVERWNDCLPHEGEGQGSKVSRGRAAKPHASSGAGVGVKPPVLVPHKEMTGKNTYEISVVNEGEGVGNDVKFDDVTTLAASDYPGTVTIDNLSQGVLTENTWNIGRMEPGAKVTATVTLDPGANIIAGDVVNTFKESGADCEATPDKCAIVGHGSTSVEKHLVSKGSFVKGEPAVYDISVTNPSALYDATGVVVTEKPAEGLDAGSLAWSDVELGDAEGDTWTIGTLAPGQTVKARVSVAVAEPTAGLDEDSMTTNVALVNNDVTGGLTECTDDAQRLGQCSTVLSGDGVSVVHKEIVESGNPTLYDIVVTNPSSDYEATGVYVKEILGDTFQADSLVWADVEAGEAEGDTWTIGTLAPGQTVKARVEAIPVIENPTEDTELINDVMVVNDRYPEPEECTLDLFDQGVCSSTAYGVGQLSVTKELISLGTAEEPTAYRVVVSNPSELYSVMDAKVVEQPGEGLDTDSLTWHEVPVGETEGNTWFIGDMEPGETHEAIVHVDMVGGYTGLVHNEVMIGSNMFDPANTCADDVRESMLCDVADTQIDPEPEKPEQPGVVPPASDGGTDKPSPDPAPSPGEQPKANENRPSRMPTTGAQVLTLGIGALVLAGAGSSALLISRRKKESASV